MDSDRVPDGCEEPSADPKRDILQAEHTESAVESLGYILPHRGQVGRVWNQSTRPSRVKNSVRIPQAIGFVSYLIIKESP